MSSSEDKGNPHHVAGDGDTSQQGSHNGQSSVSNYQLILKKYFGYNSFRGIQRNIIESIGNGNDTLGLMPTGGGKSVCFQVPALAQEGVCIVITPLIALMKDQVAHLRRKGIRATAIYSGMTHAETITALENCILGHIKLLYISPERIGSELFKNKLRRINVSFITVDEAHCISQWGYDFRPAYLHIADIRKMKPEAPVLALTATATPDVIDDITDKLSLDTQHPTFKVFRMSFERRNLAYVVREATDKPAEMKKILDAVPGCSIVFVRSRKRTKEIAEWLYSNGISATHFHAGLNSATKDRRQNEWQNNQTRVIVATNAFGMGIDKPDVRTVIHYDCPDSPEAYFQEAGRAGRDGKQAYAVLLYDRSDGTKLKRRIPESFPEREYIRRVYEHLASYYQIGVGSGRGHVFPFNAPIFCHYFHHNAILLESALELLQQAGYIEYNPEPDNAARLKFKLEHDELYRLDNLTQAEDKVVTTLLRTYGGLFTDFVYINEERIAERTGLSLVNLYTILKGLAERQILTYIPQRKTPYIGYVQNREETSRIVIPRNVYEERKEQFEKRIHAIIRYAENKEACRGQMLLAYFGEHTEARYRCGQCDICREQKREENTSTRDTKHAARLIMDYLNDGEPHPIVGLNSLAIPGNLMREALRFLAQEELILSDGLNIQKN